MKRLLLIQLVFCMISAAIGGSIVAHFNHPAAQIAVRAPPAAGMSFGEASTVSEAKNRLIAAKVWPEMEQAEVDDLTERLRKIGSGKKVAIYCINQRCEDLALNLDNAFESARWKSEVLNGVMIPPGIVCSTVELCDAFNAATKNRYSAKVDAPHNAPGDYIAIGFRQRGGV